MSPYTRKPFDFERAPAVLAEAIALVERYQRSASGASGIRREALVSATVKALLTMFSGHGPEEPPVLGGYARAMLIVMLSGPTSQMSRPLPAGYVFSTKPNPPAPPRIELYSLPGEPLIELFKALRRARLASSGWESPLGNQIDRIDPVTDELIDELILEPEVVNP